MKKYTIAFLLSSLILSNNCAVAASADNPQKIQVTRTPPADGYGGIFFTKDPERKEPAESFDCADSVHLVITDITGRGRHVLTVQWVHPSGTGKVPYSMEFDIGDEPKDAHASLKFEQGLLGRLFPLDHTSGMEKFLGRWKVKVYLDERLLAEKFFYVIC